MTKRYGLSDFHSFLISFGIYLFVVFGVFFKLVVYEKPALEYTDLKDSFINVEFSTAPKPQVSQKKKVDVNQLFAQTTNQNVKTQDINQKATDFNSLFGNVKEIQEEKTTKIQSSAKSVQAQNQALNLVKQLNDSLLNEQDLAQSSTTSQKTGIYDEFLGKVTRIITQRWNQYYPNLEKISVKVKIYIDQNGKFGYTSVEKSGNALYDAKVAEFLESQKGKFITYPPNNTTFSITMNLKDDAQTIQGE